MVTGRQVVTCSCLLYHVLVSQPSSALKKYYPFLKMKKNYKIWIIARDHMKRTAYLIFYPKVKFRYELQ